MQSDNVSKFISAFSESLDGETFVKLTLGNYKGADAHLQKILVRRIETKKGSRLFFLFRQDTRDTAKNFTAAEGTEKIRGLLGTDFFSGHLFTTRQDLQLDIGKKGKSRLNASKPTFSTMPALKHDREKENLIDVHSFYLRALGITTDKGEIRDKQHDKWKQINRFVATLAALFDDSPLKDTRELNVVDMGSGKGYLTFAAYDYFKNTRGLNVKITGVEARAELAALCGDVARASEFEGLAFVNGSISDFEVSGVDILIALHACNTATDDAIFKGITAGAELIVTAPCCHQEIRPQLDAPEMFRDILRHGIMAERTAETITDGMRALLLESRGYATKVFEFISTEHTPKNNMIVGTRSARPKDAAKFERQLEQIKEFYGIREQRLDRLLREAAKN
jgi:SAM-dependent methyltransferase